MMALLVRAARIRETHDDLSPQAQLRRVVRARFFLFAISVGVSLLVLPLLAGGTWFLHASNPIKFHVTLAVLLLVTSVWLVRSLWRRTKKIAIGALAIAAACAVYEYVNPHQAPQVLKLIILGLAIVILSLNLTHYLMIPLRYVLKKLFLVLDRDYERRHPESVFAEKISDKTETRHGIVSGSDRKSG